jgi:formamidopyrimidine-DNA glycosylase
MPELPEVETARRWAQKQVVGRIIRGVEAKPNRVLSGLSPAELKRRLVGRRIASAERHGKHLVLALTGGGVLGMHFGLTGELIRPDVGTPRNSRMMLALSDDSAVAYVDPRQFGRVALADSLADYVAQRELGPDALSVSAAAFAEALGGRRSPLKSALMD